MTARFHIAHPLAAASDTTMALPEAVAKHVQVLRLQPGARLCVFDGSGAEWPAEILTIGRREVSVRLGEARAVDREAACAVTLAIGMPANERMDGLVEKACELGAVAVLPLICERSVLRLDGERARRRQAHWQAVAVSAAEQSARAHVMQVSLPQTFTAWLAERGQVSHGSSFVLSLDAQAPHLSHALAARPVCVCLLSGPEGGLSPREEAAARDAGFVPVSLGPRVLRADTAPLAALVLATAAGG